MPPRAVIASPISSARRRVTVDGSGEQVDQLHGRAVGDEPCGSAVSVWAAADGRRRAPGIRRSTSGRRAARAPTATAHSSTGIRSSLQRAAQSRQCRPDFGDIGGPGHHRAQPEQHDRQRGDPQEVQRLRRVRSRAPLIEITGLPPANAAVDEAQRERRSTATAVSTAARRAECARS